MLINSYEVEVFTPPCEPGAERFAAKVHLNDDISEALPLLNATLPGAVYHRSARALTWKKGGHNIAFHAFEIGTSNAEDRETAQRELTGLVELVNRTWERRTEITPDFETRRRPTPLAVFRLLPQTNCRRCGEPTCFTCALKLTASQASLDLCPAVTEGADASRLTDLRDLLVEAPAHG